MRARNRVDFTNDHGNSDRAAKRETSGLAAKRVVIRGFRFPITNSEGVREADRRESA